MTDNIKATQVNDEIQSALLDIIETERNKSATDADINPDSGDSSPRDSPTNTEDFSSDDEDSSPTTSEQPTPTLVRSGGHTHQSVIIAAVIIIQDGKLLMTQEAKNHRRGKWYIPAGRVEPGETPLEGAVREAKEETGLDIQPTGIFSVEFKARNSRNWVRYGVTGTVVGGKLKDWEDKESLKAEWVPLEDIPNRTLRSQGFMRLVELYQHTPQVIPMVYSLHPKRQAKWESKHGLAPMPAMQVLQEKKQEKKQEEQDKEVAKDNSKGVETTSSPNTTTLGNSKDVVEVV